MSYFQNFPNTNFYNQDLGWLIKKYKELNGDVKILQQIYDMIKEQIKNITIEQLQEWLDDGTLENLISNNVMMTKVNKYLTNTEMINDTTLVENIMCITSGFYTNNDGGGSMFIIKKTKPDTFNLELNNGLFAEMIIKNITNPRQFGAKGNNETDDTNAINNCLKNSKNVVFSKGSYRINVSVGLLPENDSFIDLQNANLVALPSDLDYSYVIFINNKRNITIKNGHIFGERDIHLTTNGESGHCVNIRDSQNITIDNVEVSKAWGDGIFIGGDVNIPTDISILNCYSHHNRRQGISVIRGENILIEGCRIEKISGTPPSDNIDFEPNFDYEFIRNCIVKNCKFDGLVECNLSKSTVACDIKFENNIGGGYALITKETNNNCDFYINNCMCSIEKDGNVYSINIQNESENSNVYLSNVRVVSDYTLSDRPSIERSVMYCAGNVKNVHGDIFYIKGILNSLIGSSIVTNTTYSNFNVNIINVNGVFNSNVDKKLMGLNTTLKQNLIKKVSVSSFTFPNYPENYLINNNVTINLDDVRVGGICQIIANGTITLNKYSSANVTILQNGKPAILPLTANKVIYLLFNNNNNSITIL